MMTIHKYPLRLADEQTVSMPPDAEVLTVQVQRGTICIWAKHDVNGLREHHRSRRFVIFGTGHNFVERGLIYRGTIQFDEFVWHVFEAADGNA